jgi:glycosyltransferase involved in cell wall biosynthesis
MAQPKAQGKAKMKSYPGDDKARELVRAENFKQAKKLLESVVEVIEGAAAMNDLALVLAALSEWDRAFVLIDQAESRDDADIRVKINRHFISALCDFDDNRGDGASKRLIHLIRGDASLKPRLSIIMRTYNRKDLIVEAVRSALRQKFQDLELVIVNDGGDREVDRAIERVWDKRIVYAYALHSGPAGAFNVGLSLARGDLISFLDDDDIVYPDHFYRLVSHLDAHPEVKAIYTDLKQAWMDAGTGALIRERVHKAGPFLPAKLWSGFYIMNLMAMVIRRECLVRIPGFLEGLKSAVDWEFMLALSKFYSFEYLPGLAGELRYREKMSQVGKRSVFDRNLQRNIILYYYGMAPLYSWGWGGHAPGENFFYALAGLLQKHPELIPGLELRKLFREPEYALFYQLGRELEKESKKKEARMAYKSAFQAQNLGKND